MATRMRVAGGRVRAGPPGRARESARRARESARRPRETEGRAAHIAGREQTVLIYEI